MIWSKSMNDHIEKILSNRDTKLSLLDNILIYLSQNKNKIDIFEMSEIIKNDKTFYEQLLDECKNNKMLKTKNIKSLKLNEIF